MCMVHLPGSVYVTVFEVGGDLFLFFSNKREIRICHPLTEDTCAASTEESLTREREKNIVKN